MRLTRPIAVLVTLCTAACMSPDRSLQPVASHTSSPQIHSQSRLGQYGVVRVTTRDLGTLPGDVSSAATAVNDSGIVVGTSSGGGVTHAVRWLPNGSVHDLGSMGRDHAAATGINLKGWIVGFIGPAMVAAGGRSRAVQWSNGTMQIIENDSYRPNQYWASGINNSGEIIGFKFSWNPGGRGGGLFWAAGTHTPKFLPEMFGETFYPNGINDSGTIVGYEVTTDRPFEYTTQNGVTYPPLPGPNSGTASAVNKIGQVSASVFLAPAVDTYHAMILFNGSWTDLGTLTPDSGLASYGNGIDNFGFVVGQSQAKISGKVVTEAFLGGSNFTMYGLGFLPGAQMSQANGTNPNPQPNNNVDSLFVVGQGHNASHVTHAILWTVVVQFFPAPVSTEARAGR